MNEPRRQTSDVLLMCEEAQYSYSQEAAPRSFNPTVSTNTMTVSTLTDTQIGSSHIGDYLKPEDGLAKDQARQIKSRASTVATVDTPWTATTSVTAVRAFLPADVPVRATGSGSTTTVASTAHASITNEPGTGSGTTYSTNASGATGGDYWVGKGYHLLGAGGPNAGKAGKVTGFNTTGGVFSTGVTLTSTVADELFWLRKRIRPEGPPTVNVTRKSVPRTIVGFGDAVQAVGISYDASAAFELPVRGVPTAAGNATVAVPPVELSDLLSSVFTVNNDTGDKTALAAPASEPTLNVQSGGTRLTVGGFLLLPTGEAAQIRAISGTALTLGLLHMTAANIPANTVVYASTHYKRKATDFRTFTIDYFRGGLFRQVLHGCLPTLTMTITRDQVVRFAWNYTAAEAVEYTLTTPVAPGATLPMTIIDTTVPFDGKAARCLLNGTQVLLHDLTINFGFKPVAQQALAGMNQQKMAMTLEPIGGSFTILADEDDRASFEDIVDLMARSGQSVVDFLYQKGASAGNTFALAIPALQIAESPQSYKDGTGIYTAAFHAVLPQTVPGNTYDAALPALSMGFL